MRLNKVELHKSYSSQNCPDTKSGTFNNWKEEDFPQVLKATYAKTSYFTCY